MDNNAFSSHAAASNTYSWPMASPATASAFLQLVVCALQLCGGQDALLPALSAAVQAAQRSKAAPSTSGAVVPPGAGDVADLADLFSQITMHTEQASNTLYRQ